MIPRRKENPQRLRHGWWGGGPYHCRSINLRKNFERSWGLLCWELNLTLYHHTTFQGPLPLLQGKSLRRCLPGFISHYGCRSMCHSRGIPVTFGRGSFYSGQFSPRQLIIFSLFFESYWVGKKFVQVFPKHLTKT